MAGKVRVKISDMHLGSAQFTSKSEELFVDFIRNYVTTEASELEILGDAFDLAECGSWGKVMRRSGNAVKALVEVSGKVKVIYRPGNHDINVPFDDFLATFYRFMGDFPQIELCAPRVENIILRKKVGSDDAAPKEVGRVIYTGEEKDCMLCDHGYIYDHYFSDSLKVKRLNWLIRLNGGLYGMLPKHVNKMAGSIREELKGMRGDPSRPCGGPMKWLQLAARDAALYRVTGDKNSPVIEKREKPLSYVFFGHTHMPVMCKIYDDVLCEKDPVESHYVNTGCWLPESPDQLRSDFAVIQSNGWVKLHTWEKYRDGKT